MSDYFAVEQLAKLAPRGRRHCRRGDPRARKPAWTASCPTARLTAAWQHWCARARSRVGDRHRVRTHARRSSSGRDCSKCPTPTCEEARASPATTRPARSPFTPRAGRSACSRTTGRCRSRRAPQAHRGDRSQRRRSRALAAIRASRKHTVSLLEGVKAKLAGKAEVAARARRVHHAKRGARGRRRAARRSRRRTASSSTRPWRSRETCDVILLAIGDTEQTSREAYADEPPRRPHQPRPGRRPERALRCAARARQAPRGARDQRTAAQLSQRRRQGATRSSNAGIRDRKAAPRWPMRSSAT